MHSARSALAAALIASPALAQTASFEVTGSAPGGFNQSQAWGVSRDGSQVIGWTSAEVDGQVGTYGFRVTNGTPEILTDIFSRDVFATSGDGGVIVGMAFLERPDDPGNADLTGWFWTKDGGVLDLFARIPNDFSVAWDASDDGSRIVGMTNFFRDFGIGLSFSDAAVWDIQGNEQILPHLPGFDRAEATSVSADGAVVAGYEETDSERVAAIWQFDDGTFVTELPTPPGSLGSDLAMAISDNGRFVAGFSLQEFNGPLDFREDLVIWDRQNGTAQVVATTPDGFLGAVPSFISDDGSVVVGTWNTSVFFDIPEGEAFIWAAGDGIAQSLGDFLLVEHGLEIPEWELRTAKDATPDGNVIVGHALNIDRSTMFGYRVEIGSTCPADLDGDGDTDADDFFTYLDFFAQGDPRADIDGDGDRDADDFFGYLDLFGQGCP